MTILEFKQPETEEEDGDEDSYVFHCCYCDTALDDSTPDWVGVSLYNKDTGRPGQAWFAHEGCFRDKLHPDYNMKEGGIAWKGDSLE